MINNRAYLTDTAHMSNQSGTARVTEPPDQPNPPATRQGIAFCNRIANVLTLKRKGPNSALNVAAKTGDLPMVNRLLRDYSVTPGDKLQSAAFEAAAHGNTEVLKTLLDCGADPRKVLTGGDPGLQPRTFNFGRKQLRADHAVDKLKPEAVRVLLDFDHNLPGTSMKMKLTDAWSPIFLTPVELINSNPGNKNREEVCKMLVSNHDASLNTSVIFQHKAAFAESSKVDHLKLIPYNLELNGNKVHVNLLGEALMFDNFELAEELLKKRNLDPGAPKDTGAAENLLIIFMDRYSKGCFDRTKTHFNNLIVSLKKKLVTSEDFIAQLLNSQNLQFKQHFLTLFSLGFQRSQTLTPTDFEHLDHSQLDTEIWKILDHAPDSYYRAYAPPPPDYHFLYGHTLPSYESATASGFNTNPNFQED
ncbi:ankyrin repeat domain-containing protein [Endozoicomonas sp. ONNA2]|uniref:ankyrin repeat domain-containing protein n=1 Tax=Endozoicomonas sp. ONNA2 TaxID=2828741 RepID=UPI0021477E11|nr:ankyrin repeat domain-containing protein [Endozoicomonas sp. ONNA2]